MSTVRKAGKDKLERVKLRTGSREGQAQEIWHWK